ncbi:Fe-S cluster assembly protein HesB [Nocardioides ferulae]|uniref:Fe-S cluster assembly protein HesB n=1 Tax=Nocardioides ferulae TaxID=2340821 RepID=UPI000EB16816|nr:Fe-S cluster assembly protein HesB [Nocardioides ferulae]
MLHLTEQARNLLRRIPPHHADGRTAGLRIARGDGRHRFRVRAVSGPEPGDEVIDDDGARVFLGPVAAEELGGAVLDVATDDQGRAQFKTSRAAWDRVR